MKFLSIPINQVALVFRDGKLTRVLTPGSHWIGFGATEQLYDINLMFAPTQDLNLLIQDVQLAAMLDVYDIADNEVGIVYRDGKFRQVLPPGKYAYWKGPAENSLIKGNLNELDVDERIDKGLITKGHLNQYIRAYIVDTFEKGILIVNGEVREMLGPGQYFYWRNTISVAVVKTDIRQMTVDLNGQEVLTRDKAQLRINFTMQYRVNDLIKALVENKEYDKQLYTLVQLALREFVGKLSFDELMESKEQISGQVLAGTVEKAAALGVELLGFGIKDIILPGDVKEIMNQVLIAEKRAQANVIMRREETASTRSLMNTAKLMEENAMLMKLKEMEYVEKIAEKIHTITLSGGGQIVDQLRQLFVK